jgi:hypothetical protein
MSGAQIASEVATAIREAAIEVGEGQLELFLTRPPAEGANPWEASSDPPTVYKLPCLDFGFRQRTDPGTLIQRRAHILMVPALGLVPKTTDRINFRDHDYNVLAVEPVATGGVDLYYEIEIDGGVPANGVPGIDPPELIAPPEGQDW